MFSFWLCVFHSRLHFKMNITLFYPRSRIICSIRGGRAGRRQSGEQPHRFRPCLEEYRVAGFTTCLTPERWTQPFILQRMTRCECNRGNTTAQKKRTCVHVWERKSGYMERKRGPYLSAVNYWRLALWMHRQKLFLQLSRVEKERHYWDCSHVRRGNPDTRCLPKDQL